MLVLRPVLLLLLARLGRWWWRLCIVFLALRVPLSARALVLVAVRKLTRRERWWRRRRRRWRALL